MDNKDLQNEEIVLYSVKDIQKIFKIGITQSYQLMSASGFPAIRLNKKLLVPKDKLIKWIDKNCGKTVNI